MQAMLQDQITSRRRQFPAKISIESDEMGAILFLYVREVPAITVFSFFQVSSWHNRTAEGGCSTRVLKPHSLFFITTKCKSHSRARLCRTILKTFNYDRWRGLCGAFAQVERVFRTPRILSFARESNHGDQK